MPPNSSNGGFTIKVKHTGHKITLSGTLTNRKSTRYGKFGVVNPGKATRTQRVAEEMIETAEVEVLDGEPFGDAGEGENNDDLEDQYGYRGMLDSSQRGACGKNIDTMHGLGYVMR